MIRPPRHNRHAAASPDTASPQLRAYAELLLRWNASVNLIGRADAHTLWTRHIADSLQLAQLGELPPRAIDLGSGAGFPGLVLAIARGIHVDLIEQDQRKAAFLREAVRVTGADAAVHAVDIATAVLPPAPLVTARALAPLPKLLGFAERLLTPDGACLFPKSRNVEPEIAAASLLWDMQVKRFPSATDAQGVILRITHLARR